MIIWVGSNTSPVAFRNRSRQPLFAVCAIDDVPGHLVPARLKMAKTSAWWSSAHGTASTTSISSMRPRKQSPGNNRSTPTLPPVVISPAGVLTDPSRRDTLSDLPQPKETQRIMKQQVVSLTQEPVRLNRRGASMWFAYFSYDAGGNGRSE